MNALGVLLAAGYSKRLGFNKSFITFKGEYLLENAVNKLINADLKHKIIIANENNFDFLKSNYKDIKIVLNSFNNGQNSSIKKAIKYAKNCEFVMFLPIDQPFLTIKSINEIIAHFKKGHIIIPKYGEFNGLPTIFSKEFFADLSNIKGDFGGKKIAKENINRVIFVQIADILQNYDIDTMQDLQLLRREYGF